MIPISNTGLGGFFTNLSGVRYHTPSWTVVEEDTTFDDLIIEAKPFEELFKEKEEERDFQRQLLGLAVKNTPQPQAEESNVGYSTCECGEEYRSGYVAQHQRGTKHQQWETNNGAQHS